MRRSETDAVVIGAGPAGLAVAACLKRAGIPFELLERSHTVGAAWHSHYDRLHLHTDKAHSELPFLHFPRSAPKYPSRQQVIDYLEAYVRHFELEPRFNQNVAAAYPTDGGWHAETDDTLYDSRFMIIATGFNGRPHTPAWPDQASFRGAIVHSSHYTNGEAYTGKDVLVVGFGNSGAEIAIDLWEHGARPALAVRGPVNIIPRDLFGIPILAIAIPMSKLPPRLADLLSAPLVRVIIGDYSRLGLRKLDGGPFSQIDKTARIPVIDVGTVRLIRSGQIRVHPGLERFSERGVVFTDGAEVPFDAVILATGYRPSVNNFLKSASAVTDDEGCPSCSGREAAAPGLYFSGFYVSPTGMLREVGIEAKRITRDIARKRQRPAHHIV